MQQSVRPKYQFLPSERPVFPGSAAVPAHPTSRRIAYALIAPLVAVTATLGNSLVTVNVANLGGAMGNDVTETSWLPAIYVAFNMCGNLGLVKARSQFGVGRTTNVVLVTFIVAALAQVMITEFFLTVVIRAVSGICAAALTTVALYNLLQVFPIRSRPLTFVIGIGLQQLGTPLARLFPVEMLALDHWRSLHMIEIAAALVVLAITTALPLPEDDTKPAFEWLDWLTIGLMAPAMVLLCGVLNEGRLLWWFDTPWLGWALVAFVPLFASAILVEMHRANPLLKTEWLGSIEIVRFAVVAMLVRVALAEQTYGAVGLLNSGGLTNDQLRTLFVIVTVSMLLGIAVAALTLSPSRLRYQIALAALFIALGSWIESFANNLTRPPQLYLSEALISFGATLFIGPALLFGFLKAISRGPSYFISFLVLFNVTQNVGGLGGSAFLGTIQVIETRSHAEAISERLHVSDPMVAARILRGAAAVPGTVVDPGQRQLQGGAALARQVNAEATVLAYNDVSQVVALLAVLTAAYLFYLSVQEGVRRRLFPEKAKS